MKISLKALKEIPYLSHDALKGRIAPLGPFLNDSGQWDLWIPSTEDALIKLQVVDSVQSLYFAKSPVRKEDVYIDFLDLFTQRLNFGPMTKPMEAFVSDIHNLGATLQKMELFHEISLDKKRYSNIEIARFVSTELEYYFILLRSLFDIFQEIVNASFSIFYNKTTNKKFVELPTSFAKMVEIGGKPASEDDVIKKYGLPSPTAKLFVEAGETFFIIRSFRDLIAHRGESPDYIYPSEDGFLVNIDRTPFANLKIWEPETLKPNRLGFLRVALKHFTEETLRVYERFATVLYNDVDMPEPIVPGYKVFVRSDTNKGILKLVSPSWNGL